MLRFSPQAIAIDDSIEHLQALGHGLNGAGIACLQFHFNGGLQLERDFPHVRLIFADLHLLDLGGDPQRHFGILQGILEDNIKPRGPYLLVIWTSHAEDANALKDYLDERMDAAVKPVGVASLDKVIHLDEHKTGIKDMTALISEVGKILEFDQAAKALLSWEQMVLNASCEVVGDLMELAGSRTAGPVDVRRIIYQLASGAVGKKNVKSDPFNAVNEALIPILSDGIVSLRSDSTFAAPWEELFSGYEAPSLTGSEAARLNTLSHLVSLDGSDCNLNGTIDALDDDCLQNFEDTFLIPVKSAANSQFCCRGYKEGDSYTWLLASIPAACDFAQARIGTRVGVVGLEMPVEAAQSGNLPDSLWTSPTFIRGNHLFVIRFSARFLLTPPRKSKTKRRQVYRFRDSLHQHLAQHVYYYSSRAGLISYREEPSK